MALVKWSFESVPLPPNSMHINIFIGIDFTPAIRVRVVVCLRTNLHRLNIRLEMANGGIISELIWNIMGRGVISL